MNKYLIAYVSLFDNQMYFEKVEAASPEQAYLKAPCFFDENGNTWLSGDTTEEIEASAFDCDYIIGICEID